MDMEIIFGDGMKVDALFKEFKIETDQPQNAGGDASAPQPVDLFLASIGTCAGQYVLSFCKQRSIPTKGIKLILHIQKNDLSHMVEKINIEIILPSDFPVKYKDTVAQAADLSIVKKHLFNPPVFKVYATL